MKALQGTPACPTFHRSKKKRWLSGKVKRSDAATIGNTGLDGANYYNKLKKKTAVHLEMIKQYYHYHNQRSAENSKPHLPLLYPQSYMYL